ncbi:YkgJ family cysteine cluster protein [Desulfoluna sp.]|uniref:YkgJ family cysteine cluster protein n=1 Tax=Desulfoluna sp. TaxID=2045199 RepID=UPI003457C6F5
MAESAWDDLVRVTLARVLEWCPPEEIGCQLALTACDMGEYMVRKVESSQGLEGLAACQKGCGWCCHAQVPVSKPESEFLIAWMEENLPAGDFAEIRIRMDHNLALTCGSSLDERVAVWDQTPCIFLHENVCRVYPARPLVCRAWHAIDREQCRTAFVARESGAEIDNTPYRNYVLGVVRDELVKIRPWPAGGVLSLPEAMNLLFIQPPLKEKAV